MASVKRIQQNKDSVSIPREVLVNIAKTPLTLIEYKLCLLLLNRLDGIRYSMLDIENIAQILLIPKGSVREAIQGLDEQGIITRGCDDFVSDGYRFFV